MRRTVTVLAALVALAIGTLTLVQATAGADEPPGSSLESPVDASSDSAAGAPAATASPAEYAQVAFDAWRGGDATTLIRQATPSAVQLLLARPPGEETWGEPACEGAAGSTYCAWEGDTSQLVLRVANEAAAAGEPHAVGEAFFAPVSGGVAIWPLTTAEEAENTQRSVDEGHSPWMVDPATVVEFFASAELSWDQPVVEPVTDTAFRVTDRATGVAADVDVAQPARTGEGGIWAVTRLGSAST